MKRFLLFFTFNLFYYVVFAQVSVTISGKVIDGKTNEPLSYATVVFPKKSLGTISNLDGDFSLSLNEAQYSDSILISYLGYNPLKTTVEDCLNTNVLALLPLVNEIAEIKVKAVRFKLKPFMREVIEQYNRHRRSTPHIAVAHYREKAKQAGKYILYMESIGYSVYGGIIPEATPLSNYKFFCENTKSYAKHPEWIKYGRKPIGENENRMFAGGGKNLNTLRRMELTGILAEKRIGKYSFKIDSSYFANNQEILVVHFKGNNDQGLISINRTNQQIVEIACNTNKIYSVIPIDNKRAEVNVSFNYFDNTPFVSSMGTSFVSGDLQYVNSLTVLVQKLNCFTFTHNEYWSLNNYDVGPYVAYDSKKYSSFNIQPDNDLLKIEKDLLEGKMSLEEYFNENTNFWFTNKTKELELARKTIAQLKENF